jgi:protein-tyrosine phosphatase
MTGNMKEILNRVYPEFSAKVFVINEYVGDNGDVIDPYGGSIEVYEKTYLSLKNSMNLLLAKIKEDIGIQ